MTKEVAQVRADLHPTKMRAVRSVLWMHRFARILLLKPHDVHFHSDVPVHIQS